MIGIQGLDPAEIERNAVQRDRPAVAERLQHGQADAALDHVILGVDFEPADMGLPAHDLFEVLRLEAGTDTGLDRRCSRGAFAGG